MKCYVAYLWFKTRSGQLELNKAYRNRNNYWVKKLISCGFIYRDKGCIRLKSYQEVWRIMGVERINKVNGILGFRYFKVEASPENFMKDCLSQILKFIAERKKSQIVKRLESRLHRKGKLIRQTETVKFSCESTAKLFGYRSEMSGCKYRKVYFNVKKTGLPMVKYLKPSGCYFFKTPCDSISLR